jgi:hypothetical protein
MDELEIRVKPSSATYLVFALRLAVIPKLLAERLDAEQITRQGEFDTHHDGIGLQIAVMNQAPLRGVRLIQRVNDTHLNCQDHADGLEVLQ